MLEWEARKPLGVAGIGKLDPRLLNVAASLAQPVAHGPDHPESLLANAEIDERNRGVSRSCWLLPRPAPSTQRQPRVTAAQ
jgi:hypothetical protein